MKNEFYFTVKLPDGNIQSIFTKGTLAGCQRKGLSYAKKVCGRLIEVKQMGLIPLN